MRELIGFWIAAGLLAVSVAANAQTPTACIPACDLNYDGVSATAGDYGVFLAAFGTKAGQAGFSHHADRDHDGTVTAADWSEYLRTCPLRR